MTAEGWDGKSIRQHVEHVASEAARAVEIALDIEDRIESLILRLLSFSMTDEGGVDQQLAEWPTVDPLPRRAPLHQGGTK